MYLQDLSRFLGENADSPASQTLLTGYGLQATSLADNAEVPLHFLSSKDRGIQIRCDENHLIRTIFIYAVKREGFSPYQDEIFPGVSATADRKTILASFGAPGESGSDSHTFLSADESWWDRYDLGNASYHFQYTGEQGTLEFVTIREL